MSTHGKGTASSRAETAAGKTHARNVVERDSCPGHGLQPYRLESDLQRDHRVSTHGKGTASSRAETAAGKTHARNVVERDSCQGTALSGTL